MAQLLDGAAAHIQAAFEVVAGGKVVRAPDERLHDGGHAGLRGLAQVVRVRGNFAPEQQRDALPRAAVLEDALCFANAFGILGQEDHGHAVVALVGQQMAVALGLHAEEAVRNLEQDARAVAGVPLQAHAAAVLQVHEHGQRIVQHLMRALAVQVGDGADTAGVMFEFGPVQRLLPGRCSRVPLRGAGHRFIEVHFRRHPIRLLITIQMPKRIVA